MFPMKNKTYDILVYVTEIFLHALAGLYVALAKIWGFPYSAEIAGTIAAIGTFLGTALRISNKEYKAAKAAKAVENDASD